MPSSNAIVPSNNRFPTGPATDGDEVLAPSLTLKHFVAIIKRRKVIALNTFIAVMVLGIVLTWMTRPLFRTSARLLVEGQTNTVAINNGGDPLSSVFQAKSGHEVNTQIEMLRSSMIIDRVFKQANLAKGSVYLDVQRIGDTDVIELTALSNSRQAAEQFITEMPKIYEKDSRDDRLREVTAALEFAESNLKEQNSKLQRTELGLENFKNSKGISNAEAEATNAISVVTASRAALSAAEISISSLQAQVSALSAERSRIPAFIDTPTTTTNPQIGLLREQIATLRSERSRLLFLYKPQDDEVRKVDLQISDLEQRITRTPGTTTSVSRSPNPNVGATETKISETRIALRAAQDNISKLRQQVAEQNKQLGRFNNIERQQAQLQRDLLASTQASAVLSSSVLQLKLRKKALEAAGAPVSTMEAGGPAVQVAPRLERNLVLALALGALLACTAALLQESLDDNIRSEEEARRVLGTPVLGYFRELPTIRSGPILNLKNPDRILLESFRVLRSNVQFTLVNSTGRKLLVTSSVPGEGKSYVASNLAIAMALDGRRVILVDADLHRPRVHQVFDIPRQPGLTNILVGEATLQESLHEVGIPGLRVLSAGVTPPNPVELLNSPSMDALFEMLQKEADVVIFDSPPLLATADSQVMSSKVDGVIYVMQLGRVARSATLRSFELLHAANARIIGMVFNKVDDKGGNNSYNYGGYYDNPDSEGDVETTPNLPLEEQVVQDLNIGDTPILSIRDDRLSTDTNGKTNHLDLLDLEPRNDTRRSEASSDNPNPLGGSGSSKV